MKGHIRERSAGHWAIVIDVRDPQTGKRKRRWHSFAGNKRQAQVECARLISEMESGAVVDPSRITVAEFLDRFERDWIAIHTGARTTERYRGALAHVRRELGNAQLQKVRPADVAAFYATLSRSGLAPRSVQMVHRVLHRALGQAKTWGVIRDNVTEVIKPPPAPDQEKESWNPISRGSCSGDSTAIVCTRSRSSLSILGLGANELLALTIALPAVALEALRAHWRASSNSVSRSAWERRRPIARYRQPSTGSRSPPPRSPTRGCAP
jgi:hypothetical protein